MDAKEQKVLQIPTDSDTALYATLCESRILGANGKESEPFYEVALTLSTDTGSKEDGEQTAILSYAQVDTLIERLQELQARIRETQQTTSKA